MIRICRVLWSKIRVIPTSAARIVTQLERPSWDRGASCPPVPDTRTAYLVGLWSAKPASTGIVRRASGSLLAPRRPLDKGRLSETWRKTHDLAPWGRKAGLLRYCRNIMKTCRVRWTLRDKVRVQESTWRTVLQVRSSTPHGQSTVQSC